MSYVIAVAILLSQVAHFPYFICAVTNEVVENDALVFVNSLFGYLTNTNVQSTDEPLTLYQAAMLVSENVESSATEQWVVGGSAYDEPVFPECWNNGGE